jgi:hypothetical protein
MRCLYWWPDEWWSDDLYPCDWLMSTIHQLEDGANCNIRSASTQFAPLRFEGICLEEITLA